MADVFFFFSCCSLLVTKLQDELKALQLCQSKVRAKKLPMEVIDAEYQWYVLNWSSSVFSFFMLTVFSVGTAES